MRADDDMHGGEAPSSAEKPPKPLRLLDQVREAIRYRHYSYRTEEACVEWARRFIRFHGRRHPSEMGAHEVVAYLTHLATERIAPLKV